MVKTIFDKVKLKNVPNNNFQGSSGVEDAEGERLVGLST